MKLHHGCYRGDNIQMCLVAAYAVRASTNYLKLLMAVIFTVALVSNNFFSKGRRKQNVQPTDFNNFSDTLVSIKNVDKTFNKGSVNEVSLFKGFSLDIIKNQFVSVVGSNGSGKTTLLNLICGNMETDTGNIYLKDRNITNLKEHPRAKFIGRVFQDPSKGPV
jgi:ABC-type glutathione transport system ATPase component